MKGLLTILLIFGFQIGFAQSGFVNSPTVIGNGGETWTQGDYNLSFTLGEVAIETFIKVKQFSHKDFIRRVMKLHKLMTWIKIWILVFFLIPQKTL